MHARRRGRAPSFGRRGAEGATAPETLRQKDRGRKGALESGGRDISRRPLTEGVSRGHGSHRGRSGESLRVHGQRGHRPDAVCVRSVGGAPVSIPVRRCGAARRTPLYDLHRALGATMVPFAGYEMPVQYPTGIIAEHLHTRAAGRPVRRLAYGPDRGCAGAGAGAGAGERWCRAISQALAPGSMRYTLLLNETGGILDDLMVTPASSDGLLLVVNAACKEADLAHLQRASRRRAATIEPLFDRALLALQGPLAAAVLARLAPRDRAACSS